MLALVGDIGGTNARFGLAEVGRGRAAPRDVRTLPTGPMTAAEAVSTYLSQAGARPEAVVLAVAGPVRDGAVEMTNAGWRLSEAGLRESGFGHALIINDFVAQAWAAPLLANTEKTPIGGPAEGPAGETVAVVGPGTGLGLSALAYGDGGAAALATEGGHVAFAPHDDVEIEVLGLLAKRYGRVSVERILSGPGLADLYDALGQLAGRAAEALEPAEVSRRAEAGEPEAVATVERFCAILGAFAGDVALALGARGGVYLAGGIPPRLSRVLASGGFRTRFEDKGRFRRYMETIPTWIVTAPDAALLGAAAALERRLAPRG